MLLLILEFALFTAGFLILGARTVPQRFLRWFFGPGEYEIQGTPARLLGFLLTLPFMITLALPFLLQGLFGEAGLELFTTIELIVLVVVVLLGALIARRAKK